MQKCPTCFEPLTSGSTNHTVTTPCGHLFHMNCVQGWIARGNQTCPQCRSNISKDKLLRIYLQPSESDDQTPQETDENQQKSENSRWSMTANSVAYFNENELSNQGTTRSTRSARSTKSTRFTSSTRTARSPGSESDLDLGSCFCLFLFILFIAGLTVMFTLLGKDQVSFKN